MPITIKTGLMKYKSQSTGDYIGINAVSDNETAAQIAAIEQKGAEVLEWLPSDYTELAQDVSELKNDPKIYVVTENESGVLNKTWKEIVDASENHTVCLIAEEENNGNTTSVSVSYFEDAGQMTSLYYVKFSSQGEFRAFTTNSQNGYPSFNEDASRSLDDDIRAISDKIDNNILAQQTQPTAEDNKLWIDTTEQATPVQVASYEELTAVSNALSKSSENTSIAISAHPVGDLFWYNGTLHVATSAIAVGDTIVDSGTGANCKDTTISEALIKDIQVNGVSILTDGVANVPPASSSSFGAVKIGGGLRSAANTPGQIMVNTASPGDVRNSNGVNPVAGDTANAVAFFGLARAAGDTTQANVTTIGTYTESAKSAISGMLNDPVTISGTTPVITAKSGIRYICGECATLDITVPSSGIVDVVFESGSTPTVLTVTPPTGMTMKWIGDDPTALEANKTYEINIKDGCLGMVVSWT